MFRHLSPKAVVVMLAAVAVVCTHSVWAQNTGSVQGVIKNSSGAPVSGAFVKLKNADRRLTFMVISQAQGRYTASTLPPGKYVVQGIGGEFQSGLSAPVDVAAGRAATVDLSLTVQRAPALAPAWPGRLPGQGGGEAEAARPGSPPALPEGEGKRIIETKCIGCHDAQRTVNARADRARWLEIIHDMRIYAQGSTLAKDLTDQEEEVLLDYVATNFSDRGGRERPKPDPNSRLPRTLLQGEATRYIAVEYELPNTNAEPHEVTVDSDGNGWVTQRRGGKLGRLDPKTLVYTEIAPPPAPSKNLRLNAIWAGPNNELWFVDGGPNRRWLSYDTKTKEFSVFTLPKMKTGTASGNTMRTHPNGTVWMNSIGSNQVIRLDPKTKEFTVFEVPSGVKAGRSASPYGMAISGDGQVWIMLNAMNKMGRVDPVTGNIEEFDIPVENAVPRKAGPDADGNVWVGLHGAGKLMKIDYKTTKMTVYSPPTENSGVYAASVDLKNNLVWFAQQHVDKIGRFDPKTETFVEFPLANAEEDHRRIEVDQNNPKRIWWSGNLSGRMGYIELLDGK
ncbi:MAG: carboxypeptidase regulatory-like domain-containing protein [Acidobacteria bacterium]|nr:carboxypeptidase regulatory-like domain-containing protein [Acidobacteriota bacterium]